MLEEVTQVARVASDKAGVPIMAAMLIQDGKITASNGAVTLTVLCPDLTGHTFAVDADRFLSAVKASDGAPKLKLTEGGKLSITHGKFRALLPLFDADSYPSVEYSEGDGACPPDFIEHLRILAPFIAKDKSRPWACGVLLHDDTLTATNGTVLVRATVHGNFTCDSVLPLAAVEALLQIGDAPSAVMLAKNSATFHWPNGRVLFAALLSYPWPDLNKMLADAGTQTAVPDGLAEAVTRVMPFCPNKDHPIVRLTADGKVCTADGDSSGAVGGFTFAQDAAFVADDLLAVLALASSIDLSMYPSPVPFSRGAVRGVLAGVRL